MTQDEEMVVLVDDEDNSIGTMEKMEAHKKGVLHRAFSVVLFNNRNELLLQQRALNKYHCASLWTNTCCSHPFPGEEILDAANRRLKEEMGIECALQKSFTFIYKARFDNGLTEHEFDHVFLGRFSGTPVINTDEVVDWKYISLPDLKKDMAQNPEAFTPWFKIIVSSLEEKQLLR